MHTHLKIDFMLNAKTCPKVNLVLSYLTLKQHKYCSVRWDCLDQINKCVSSNGSENFRKGKNTLFFFFFFGKNIILCILKGEFAFQNAFQNA